MLSFCSKNTEICRHLETLCVYNTYERFHLNHRQAFPNNDLNVIENIESILNKLNTTCYLLSISNSKVLERLVVRDNDLSLLTESDIQLKVNDYIRSRDELALVAKSSLLEHKALNTDGFN